MTVVETDLFCMFIVYNLLGRFCAIELVIKLLQQNCKEQMLFKK